eukprot:c19822_g1_i7.p1 GENE.c19822_g1_i7~~c19822_g1_i7.p1  ORF type:complete len:148 (-),score=5.58 c19822_g1_i7:222-665(-)
MSFMVREAGLRALAMTRHRNLHRIRIVLTKKGGKCHDWSTHWDLEGRGRVVVTHVPQVMFSLRNGTNVSGPLKGILIKIQGMEVRRMAVNISGCVNIVLQERIHFFIRKTNTPYQGMMLTMCGKSGCLGGCLGILAFVPFLHIDAKM